jgi:hypothetical protein
MDRKAIGLEFVNRAPGTSSRFRKNEEEMDLVKRSAPSDTR